MNKKDLSVFVASSMEALDLRDDSPIQDKVDRVCTALRGANLVKKTSEQLKKLIYSRVYYNLKKTPSSQPKKRRSSKVESERLVLKNNEAKHLSDLPIQSPQWVVFNGSKYLVMRVN